MFNRSLDPDRPYRFVEPGSQEWWYFDAISHDGRDALVIVWYLGLPFDPSYGVSACKHLKDPARYPAPRAVDHSAVGFSWYRDGKVVAYALNSFPARSLTIQDEPFQVEIGPSRLARTGQDYSLKLRLPDLATQATIVADLSFKAPSLVEPYSSDLGGAHSAHFWHLALADARVEGWVELAGRRCSVDFKGRGYHDHNAGVEELSLAWKRWGWARVHFGPFTAVHYEAEPRGGEPTSLALLFRDGRLVSARSGVEFKHSGENRTRLGLRHAVAVETPPDLGQVPGIRRTHRAVVDDGPFYLRWLSDFEIEGHGTFQGISELLEGDRLNRPLFNWMIPYRLKKPWG